MKCAMIGPWVALWICLPWINDNLTFTSHTNTLITVFISFCFIICFCFCICICVGFWYFSNFYRIIKSDLFFIYFIIIVITITITITIVINIIINLPQYNVSVMIQSEQILKLVSIGLMLMWGKQIITCLFRGNWA